MNIIKTPQQKLLEEAGAIPPSPGMLKTPQQLLLEESGVRPTVFAKGGSTNNTMSPQDMLAMLIALGYHPQKLKGGGEPKSLPKRLLLPAAITGLLAPDIVSAAQEAQQGKYGEAAGTAGLIASGFLPSPLQALLFGLMPGELGRGTLDEYYNERVPGSVLPARLKPQDMK